MKKLLLIVMFSALASGNALADGFECYSRDGMLYVNVYNKVQPIEGVRNAAVMIMSDKTVAAGNKTIAVFTDAKNTIKNKGAYYTANVDLRVIESRRKGEMIPSANTKLGFVKSFELGVDFYYSNPVANGSHVNAKLLVNKRDGKTVLVNMGCVRYLKTAN